MTPGGGESSNAHAQMPSGGANVVGKMKKSVSTPALGLWSSPLMGQAAKKKPLLSTYREDHDSLDDEDEDDDDDEDELNHMGGSVFQNIL